MSGQRWRIEREWQGQRCFIVAGGPSVLQNDLQQLREHRVIAINCSFRVVPFAEFLLFGDTRFWLHYQKEIMANFAGRIVSCSSTAQHPRLLRVNRKTPPGIARDPGCLSIRFTSLIPAINLAVHLGVNSIVLLGADGKEIDGKSHHHAPHPWRTIPGCWDKQKSELTVVAKELKELGVECVNASPGSAWADIWPIVKLEDYVTAGSNNLAAAAA